MVIYRRLTTISNHKDKIFDDVGMTICKRKMTMYRIQMTIYRRYIGIMDSEWLYIEHICGYIVDIWLYDEVI